DHCGRGASYAAAGMLGPIMEVEFSEPEQLELNQRSHQIYPEFIDGLEEETDTKTGFRTNGTYMVATTPAEAEELERLHEY
ncbi:MAG: FAD-dependent oxidoreductase, partial [bacterium]